MRVEPAVVLPRLRGAVRDDPPQGAAGAVEPHLDVPFHRFERLGGLRGAQPLGVAQHEHEPIAVRQLLEGGVKEPPQLAVGGDLVRPRPLVTNLGTALHAAASAERVLASLPSRAGERLVHDDSCQPGREAGAPLKLLELRPGAHVTLLHHVFGLVVIADDGPGDAIEPRVVAAHDELELRGVTRAHARPVHALPPSWGDEVAEARVRGGASPCPAADRWSRGPRSVRRPCRPGRRGLAGGPPHAFPCRRQRGRVVRAGRSRITPIWLALGRGMAARTGGPAGVLCPAARSAVPAPAGTALRPGVVETAPTRGAREEDGMGGHETPFSAAERPTSN